jgi:toxin-antitoxin system PIN domain toxin
MVISDVNVLIYAFRRGSTYHDECRGWLQGVIEGDEAFGVSELVMSAVVRIVTGTRHFGPPESLDDAFAFVNTVMNDDKAIRLSPGLRHWEIFERICRESLIRGNRTSDAYLAALAIEHGCELITTDGDFSRFKGLRWRRPF